MTALGSSPCIHAKTRVGFWSSEAWQLITFALWNLVSERSRHWTYELGNYRWTSQAPNILSEAFFTLPVLLREKQNSADGNRSRTTNFGDLTWISESKDQEKGINWGVLGWFVTHQTKHIQRWSLKSSFESSVNFPPTCIHSHYTKHNSRIWIILFQIWLRRKIKGLRLLFCIQGGLGYSLTPSHFPSTTGSDPQLLYCHDPNTNKQLQKISNSF